MKGKQRLMTLVAGLVIPSANARDDGRYAKSHLKSWFDYLASGRCPCCSFADGFVVEDPDWTVMSDVAKPDVTIVLA
jgi:hypothetical protein